MTKISQASLRTHIDDKDLTVDDKDLSGFWLFLDEHGMGASRAGW